MKSEQVIAEIQQPFPGLRPFRRRESDLFFGRGEQIDELLATLEDNHFVAVVGASGSGKSSLVRAGLLPALEAGFLSGAGPEWRMVLMRPGNAPFSQLAEALLAAADGKRESDPQAVAFVEATLRSGSQGLLEAIQDMGFPPGTNILLLVDQFEEIFRFRHRRLSAAFASDQQTAANERNEATGFVNMLLATAAENDSSLYGVITMRSDFLGDCDAFHGLPEAINRGQFLVPRLRREQLQDTITGPLDLFGASATEGLVNRILNEVGSDPDQLPLMQHLLSRMWSKVDQKNSEVTLQVSDYEAVGGLENALSRHADEAYEELADDESKRIAGVMFRCLCDQGAEARLTRRLVTVSEVAAVAGVATGKVNAVAQVFLDPDRSFLTQSTPGELNPNTTLDISHETLMRQWGRLADLVSEESQSAAKYRRLMETARLWKRNQASLLDSPELDIALDWRNQEKPTKAWADRYGGTFDLSMEFLDASLTEQQAQADRQERDARRKTLTLIATLAVVSTLMIAAGILGLQSHVKANQLNDMFIKSQLSLGTASIQDGRMREGLDRFWSAYDKTASDQPARRSARNLIASWSQLAGQPLIHDGAVRTAVFSADGNTILTVTDEAARLWDPKTGGPISKRFNADGGGPWQAIAVNPDGTAVLVAHTDSAQIWDVRTRKSRGKPFQHGDTILEVAFHPKGGALVTKSEHEIRLWNIETGALLGEPLQLQENEAFALSPAGNVVFLGGSSPRLFDFASEELTRLPATEPVRLVAFSPDASMVITASGLDGTAQLWNTPKLTARGPPLKQHGIIKTIAFSPDSTLVLTGSDDNTAQLWDTSNGARRGRPLQHQGTVVTATFGPDGKTVLTGSADNTARLWDTLAGDALSHPFRHAGTVHAVAFSPDGQTMLTGGVGGATRLWGIQSRGFQNADLSQDALSVLWSAKIVAYSPDGSMVLIANDGNVNLWDVAARRELEPVFRHGANAVGASFGPQGKTIFTAGGQSARLWDIQNTENPIQELRLESTVTAAAISPDGRTLITASGDNYAQLWDFPSGDPAGKPLKHGDQILAIAFSPDGQFVATGSRDNTAMIWDVLSSANQRTPLAHRDAVSDVTFSRDGKTLFTASYDTKARFWDVDSGELLGDPLLHSGEVITAIYHPNGRQALTIERGGNVRLWDIVPPAADEPKRLRLSIEWRTGTEVDSQTAIHPLTQAEWLERKQTLDSLGGPCDVLGWDDLMAAEQKELAGKNVNE